MEVFFHEGGPEFFCVGQGLGPEFFGYAEGGDPRSQADGPTLPVKNDSSLT